MQPVEKFSGHLLLPSLKVNKRVVDASCIKVLWSPFVTFSQGKQKNS